MERIFLTFQATRISKRNRKSRGGKRLGLAVMRALTPLSEDLGFIPST